MIRPCRIRQLKSVIHRPVPLRLCVAETSCSPDMLMSFCRVFSIRFPLKAKHSCRHPQRVTSGEGFEAHAIFGTFSWNFCAKRLCFLLFQCPFHYPLTTFKQSGIRHPPFV
jgi:hypothetical protein